MSVPVLAAFTVALAIPRGVGPAYGRDTCTDPPSAIVGEQRCRRYGAGWAIPLGSGSTRHHVVIGLRANDLDLAARTFRTDRHGTLPGSVFGGRLRTYGPELGVLFAPVDWLELGPRAGVGLGETRVGPERWSIRGADLGLGAALRRRVGTIDFRLGLLFGGSFLALDWIAGDTRTIRAARRIEPLCELHVGAAAWLSPTWTLGAYVATRHVALADRSFGLSLSWHARALDGMP